MIYNTPFTRRVFPDSRYAGPNNWDNNSNDDDDDDDKPTAPDSGILSLSQVWQHALDTSLA